MSECHSYNLSAWLAIDHRTCRPSARSLRASLALLLSYHYRPSHRSCQEQNAVCTKVSSGHFLGFYCPLPTCSC